jgi:hypothetical protein
MSWVVYGLSPGPPCYLSLCDWISADLLGFVGLRSRCTSIKVRKAVDEMTVWTFTMIRRAEVHLTT